MLEAGDGGVGIAGIARYSTGGRYEFRLGVYIARQSVLVVKTAWQRSGGAGFRCKDSFCGEEAWRCTSGACGMESDSSGLGLVLTDESDREPRAVEPLF